MAFQTTPGTVTAGAAAPGLPASEQRKLQSEVNEEYHDPYDDWSVRDILLALVPFIVSYAFKDTALRAALAFGTAFSWFLLLSRYIAWDARYKLVWALLDIINCLAFPILLGMTYVNYYQIHKWWPIILPAIYGFSVLLSIAIRRPFTAHYARYPKFDKGGAGVFRGDEAFRRTSDMSSMFWAGAFSIMCLLSLIPVLTGHWDGYTALNVIFDYIVPAALIMAGLLQHQLMGMWYRKSAATRVGTATEAYPAGVEGAQGGVMPTGTRTTTTTEGAPTTYSSAV